MKDTHKFDNPAPIALEPSDVAAVGLDFVPKSFVGGVVKKNAALVSREGDFGFSQENGEPSAGHDVELVNFTSQTNPSELQLCGRKRPQAFTSRVRGINRPTTIRFGPDGAAYLVNYGAVRDGGICPWCKSRHDLGGSRVSMTTIDQ